MSFTCHSIKSYNSESSTVGKWYFKEFFSFSKQRIQLAFLSWYNLNPTLYIFSSMPLKSGESGTILSKRSHFEGSRDQYSYGWSFVLATLGFLGSELSALLCLAAFLNRFDSEVIKFWLPLYIFKYTREHSQTMLSILWNLIVFTLGFLSLGNPLSNNVSKLLWVTESQILIAYLYIFYMLENIYYKLY